VVGEFIDDGVSATANRPEDRNGWASAARTTDFDAVIIWKVDRLARRVLDFLHADEALQNRGAGLVAVEDPIDMTSPQGRAFAVMLAVFGEMEAEAIRRSRPSGSGAASEGRPLGWGAVFPYGYQFGPEPRRPWLGARPDPARQPWLAEVVGKALGGATVNAITTWLTAEGAPLPEGFDHAAKVGRDRVEPADGGRHPPQPGPGWDDPAQPWSTQERKACRSFRRVPRRRGRARRQGLTRSRQRRGVLSPAESARRAEHATGQETE
jgi:site-specific DNA recombinase